MHFYVCVGGETAFFSCLISAMEIKCIFFVHVSSFCWWFQSATTLVSMHILEIKAASCVPECKATRDLRILTINELIYRHQHKRAPLSRHSGIDFHRLSTKFDSFSSRTISVNYSRFIKAHSERDCHREWKINIIDLNRFGCRWTDDYARGLNLISFWGRPRCRHQWLSSPSINLCTVNSIQPILFVWNISSLHSHSHGSSTLWQSTPTNARAKIHIIRRCWSLTKIVNWASYRW